MHCQVDIYLSLFVFRNWVEESYFQPVGRRTLSNQALYLDKNVIVIYTSIRSGTIKMINYVKNRAVAVATEVLKARNNSTDIETHANVGCMKKQVNYRISKQSFESLKRFRHVQRRFQNSKSLREAFIKKRKEM